MVFCHSADTDIERLPLDGCRRLARRSELNRLRFLAIITLCLIKNGSPNGDIEVSSACLEMLNEQLQLFVHSREFASSHLH